MPTDYTAQAGPCMSCALRTGLVGFAGCNHLTPPPLPPSSLPGLPRLPAAACSATDMPPADFAAS